MGVFDKGTILGFTENVSQDLIDENCSRLVQILTSSITDLSKKNAIISKDIQVVPINEFATGAITPISSLDVFLVIKSPQIELNTVKVVKNKFKSFWERLKFAWKKSRIKKKRKRRNKNITEQTTLNAQLKGKYDINDLCLDLVNNISNYITPLSIVSSTNAVVSITGDDFSFPVNVYPAIKKENTYSVYNKILNKFFEYNFTERFENLKEMASGKEDKVLNLIKIYNMLYFNLYNKALYQPFVESLIYNLPDNIFESDDIYEIFIRSINFLNNARWQDFVSILDKTKPMFKDERLQFSLFDTLDFIKNVKNNL